MPLPAYHLYSNSRRLAATTVAVIAIVVVGWAGYAVYHARNRASLVAVSAMANAAVATRTGDYAAAYRLLKNSEPNATTSEQRVLLYGDLAAAAANAGKLDEAITYYTARHTIDPDTRLPDAELLANMYARTGDSKQAIAQYQLAKQYTLAQPASTARNSHVQTLQVIIADLEANP
ncbi:MAG TPA: hypothetical protein VLE73_06740 [Candidatus Saccharimonadales bacterium]|nr:hypothetical protein [Candidatus Saccharimonadales bacterium]